MEAAPASCRAKQRDLCVQLSAWRKDDAVGEHEVVDAADDLSSFVGDELRRFNSKLDGAAAAAQQKATSFEVP